MGKKNNVAGRDERGNGEKKRGGMRGGMRGTREENERSRDKRLCYYVSNTDPCQKFSNTFFTHYTTSIF